MLYTKDNIINDSSLIVLDINGQKIYNPKDSDLISAGWTKVSDECNTNEIFIKKTFYTNSTEFNQLDKAIYKDCLVFIEDTKQHWLNGVFYGEDGDWEYVTE